MSSDISGAADDAVCLYCGAARAAWGPFAPNLDELGQSFPRLAAWIRHQGFIQATHGAVDANARDQLASHIGSHAQSKGLCGHRFEDLYFRWLSELEIQLQPRPQESDPAIRRELFELVASFPNCKTNTGVKWTASQKVVAEAVYTVALLRKRLPGMVDFCDEDQKELYRAVEILLRQPDPWILVRSLIQLLRAAPVPTLAPDLRYWLHAEVVSPWPMPVMPSAEDRVHAEDLELANQRQKAWDEERAAHPEAKIDWAKRLMGGKPPPPDGWSMIPMELAYSLHDFIGPAEKSDPALGRLRTKFARYLLDRLKPQESDYEHDHSWRIGCLRAVEALQINPADKGHRTVFVLMEKDPHEAVRQTAKAVYPSIRRAGVLHASPRRAVLNALWELFRAHMVALGVTLDEAGAARTKREMIRRTTRPS